VIIYVIQGIAYGFAAAVQPGPFQTYIISQTLKSGWRPTLPAAFAPLVSDGLIIVLVLLVLSQVPIWFQRVLYVVGGVFIVYLAYSAFKGWRNFEPVAMVSEQSTSQSLFRAATMNVLSPGPYIFWSLVTGPILIAGWRESPANGLGLLAGFYLTMIATLMGVIGVFATARHLGPRINRAMLGISAVALLGFGVYQVCRGIWGV
jgi:threonine/homoserine/homoserine lactone efflux protein